jgi:threonine dehydrogenase-like Zn-dependent dehydrogenase
VLRGVLHATRKGGTVMLVPDDTVLSEHSPQDFADTIAMLQDGSMATEGIIAERIELDDVVRGAFDELVDDQDRHVKILVRTPS